MSFIEDDIVEEFDKNLMEQHAKIEEYKQVYKLNNDQISTLNNDRFDTGYDQVRLESKWLTENNMEEKAKATVEQLYKLQGKESNQAFLEQVTSVPAEIGEKFYTNKLKTLDKDIAQARLDNPLDYDLKTFDELKNEHISEYQKIVSQDDRETFNSDWVGSLKYAAGAMVGYATDPSMLAIYGVGTGVAGAKTAAATFGNVGLKSTLKGATQMAGYEAALYTAEYALNRPSYYELRKDALGEDISPKDKVVDYAMGLGMTVAGSYVGTFAAKTIADGFRWTKKVEDPLKSNISPSSVSTAEQPTKPFVDASTIDPSLKGQVDTATGEIIEPNSSQEGSIASGEANNAVSAPWYEKGPITKGFVERFNKVVEKMDPNEADVIGESIEMARNTPPELDQMQHAENMKVASAQVARGEDVDVPYKDKSMSERIQEDPFDIEEAPGIKEEVAKWSDPENSTDKFIDADLSALETRFKELGDDFAFEEGIDESGKVVKQVTVADFREKIRERVDDIDALDQVFKCWSSGGPKLSGQ